MYSLTILVPATHPDAKRLEDTLASILRHRPVDCEVIVVHSGWYLDPHRISPEVRFLVNSKAGRLVDAILHGLAQAQGRVIHLLRPGIEVHEDWCDKAMDAFAEPVVGAVSVPIIDMSRSGNILVDGVTSSQRFWRKLRRPKKNRRSKEPELRGTGPTSWAGFFRREALDWLAPFLSNHCAEGAVDLEISLAMRALGYSTASIAESAVSTDFPAEILNDAPRQTAYDAQRLQMRYGEARTRASILFGAVKNVFLDTICGLWRHGPAMGRLSALSQMKIDRAWALELQQIAEQLTRIRDTKGIESTAACRTAA